MNKNRAEYWVVEYKGEEAQSYIFEQGVDGPFDSKRKAENAMVEHISRGRTGLAVIEVTPDQNF